MIICEILLFSNLCKFDICGFLSRKEINFLFVFVGDFVCYYVGIVDCFYFVNVIGFYFDVKYGVNCI